MGNIYEDLPEWFNEGTEPDDEKKEEGWEPGERPAAGFWNWFMNRTAEALEAHDEALNEIDGGEW